MIVVSKLKQSGMSLIELMIAMVLGVFLMLGIVEIFSGTKATYNMQDGLSRIQENARFATGVLGREVKLAGVLGCGSMTSFATTSSRPQPVINYIANTADPLLVGAEMTAGVRGYEFTGTAPGATAYALPFSAPATVVIAATSWGPPLPATPLLAGQVVAGSDVLVIRYARSPQAVINAAFPGTAAAAPQVILHDVPAVPADYLVNGAVYVASDCAKGTIFLGQRVSSTTLNAPTPQNTSPWTSEETYGGASGITYLSSVSISAYYVGVGASGEPSLFRAALQPNAAGVMAVVREELVEGIESMQLLFGIPVAARTPGIPATAPAADQFYYREGADNFVTAADIADVTFTGMNDLNSFSSLYPNPVNIARRWQNVRSVKIALLIRSPEQVRTDLDEVIYEVGRNTGRTIAVPNATVAATRINPQDDRRLRQVYELVVQPRNQVAQRALPSPTAPPPPPPPPPP